MGDRGARTFGRFREPVRSGRSLLDLDLDLDLGEGSGVEKETRGGIDGSVK